MLQALKTIRDYDRNLRDAKTTEDTNSKLVADNELKSERQAGEGAAASKDRVGSDGSVSSDVPVRHFGSKKYSLFCLILVKFLSRCLNFSVSTVSITVV